MNTPCQLPFCALQSDICTGGRRVMIFTGRALRSGAGQKPHIRRRLLFRLNLVLEPEAQSRFEPVIQVHLKATPSTLNPMLP